MTKELLRDCKRDKEILCNVDYWDKTIKDPKCWRVVYVGPKNSPYEGGIFTVKVIFPDDYPNTRPQFFFITKIYHLNIDWVYDCNGKVCFGTYVGNDIKTLLKEVNKFFISQNEKSTWYNDTVRQSYLDYKAGKSKVFYEEAQKWVYLYAGLRELNK